jgi:metal-dependent amidase/aminoacylase/carboxypeptidase family protein
MAEVHVKGLAELQRQLRRADRELRKKVDARLAQTATEVAAEARAIAESKGLRESGDLIRNIKPFVRIGIVGVTSSARHRGYPYPRRLEYEGRGGGKVGPRAHLNPAVDDTEPKTMRELSDVLTDLYETI